MCVMLTCLFGVGSRSGINAHTFFPCLSVSPDAPPPSYTEKPLPPAPQHKNTQVVVWVRAACLAPSLQQQ
jgi:hypothetical protein